MTCKKLIEVAIPIKEISAESVRDKSIRHGHISTLHLWWARRPLPVCRAIVFASLVPDPLDPACPQAFRDAVELLLGKENNLGDPYATYLDIPWTAVFDPMDDNLRNRLQMFIGKFTNDMQQHLLHNIAKPQAGDMLTEHSLIKWDNKNNDQIINKARKLIWVAHNSKSDLSTSASPDRASELLASFDTHYQAIKNAEQALYSLLDRHIETKEVKDKQQALDQAIEAFIEKMPLIFDPFAGGGAIPLEAARLGCRSYGNDINPVAHIIQKGSLEFPQKYGKPITYSNEEFIKKYSIDEFNKVPNERKVFEKGNAVSINIPNRLSFDVEIYAKKLLARAEKEIGHLYAADEKGKKPIAYYWAKVGTCSNPSCRAEIPLLKGFYLANNDRKKIYLNPIIKDKSIIDFEIKEGSCNIEGWIKNRKLICPCCGNATNTEELKKQSINKTFSTRLIAVIEDSENGKSYRLPNVVELIKLYEKCEIERIHEEIVKGDSRNLWITLWGMDTWGDLFSNRQLYALQNLVKKLTELKLELDLNDDYSKALVTYLGILIDRIAVVNTSFGRWNVSGEKIESPFARQSIAMMFDYPESNIFCNSTGSALNQLDWIIRYINSENTYSFSTYSHNASSGDKSQFIDKYLTAVVTDPPYYDAIAYADLSDFFYVWFKRTLGDVYPLNFATPQTPKTEECTALKHHHKNNEAAKIHFENKLTQIFDAIEHQTSDIVSIMFAHQSTEAWTTLCNSILTARMNITGSWPIDTEMANRSLGLSSAVLASSVTVSARPAQRRGFGNYKEIKKAIEITVEKEVKELYALGFRGADLLTACFGQAVSEFGKYEKVEKADGSEVTVAELLEIAREGAFNALLKGFDGDEFTKFYIGWLQLYGFAETDFDDAAKFSRVGLTINVSDLFNDHILIKKNGNKQTLGSFEERMALNKHLGENETDKLIDQVQRGMFLYNGANRKVLLQYIGKVANTVEANFWRVLTSICEILPAATEDRKQASGLLSDKESLIRESKNTDIPLPEQTKLF